MLELKAGGDRAAYQRPVAHALGGLPMAGRDDVLWPLARGQISAQNMILWRVRIVRGHRQDQGCACMEQPDLGAVDAVPMRVLASFEKVVNRRSRRTAGPGSGPALAVPAPLGMRRQIQRRDYLVSGHRFRIERPA